MEKNNEWLNDEYVKEWFIGLSEASTHNYTKEFPKWLAFIKMTPTEQIDKRLNDLQSKNPRIRAFFERKVVEFKDKLEKEGYAKNTIEKNYLRTVQSFFARNRLALEFKRGELTVERRRKVEKAWVPSNEEIRVMYSMADLRDRALLLMLYHSGYSEIDVSNMNIEDFDFYDKNGEWKASGHMYHKRFREKTDVEHMTCISEECLHDIKLMLQARNFPKDGALFLSHKNQRLSVRFIHQALKKLCAKAHPDKAKLFETKNLRDTYHDALARADVKEAIQKRMFGHKPQGAEANYYVSAETIKEAYKKAFRYLTINSGRREREELETVHKQITELQATIKMMTHMYGNRIYEDAIKKVRGEKFSQDMTVLHEKFERGEITLEEYDDKTNQALKLALKKS